LSIAAPLGPIGVLCIRRTLAYGWLVGLVTGVGAASADAFYASLAGFGITFIAKLFIDQAVWIRLIGGIFLCYLGVKIFQTNPRNPAAIETEEVGLMSAYASAFLLTVTNPMTILSFAAIFAGLGLGSQAVGLLSASVLISGVFVGSVAWWLTLSGIVSLFRKHLDQRSMRWVNRISGMVILGFGLIAVSLVLVDSFISM
jgi:threonine/homoserine/homoserine lactone efflux protein